MTGFHPIAAALHKAGTIPPPVLVGVSASVLVVLLFVAVAASSRFAASRIANAIVILAAVAAILLCLLGAVGIVLMWLSWGFSIDCIPGDPEYPCPSLFAVLTGTLGTIALLGLPAFIVWLTTRRLKN